MSAARFNPQKNNLLFQDPLLISDRSGIVGEPLGVKLSKELLVVLVSKKFLGLHGEKNETLIHVPFSKKFPLIPDNRYSHIIVVDEEDSLEFLPKVIEKARNTNAEFVFVKRFDRKISAATQRTLSKLA